MIGRIILLSFIGCAALAGILWFKGGPPARLNPHPSFIEEEILDESISSINRYLIPEINKVLPNRVYGTGHKNMIGFEELDIILFCPSNNLEEIERDCMLAYHAAQKGLLTCKRLYNQTNHGPTSPNLIYIEVITPHQHILAGVYHGKFFTRETFASTQWDELQKQSLAFQSAKNLLQDIGDCNTVSYYTSKIEPKQPAIGIALWVLVGRVPTLEEGLEIYKKNTSRCWNGQKYIIPTVF